MDRRLLTAFLLFADVFWISTGEFHDECLLEKSYTDCGFSQGKDDDFDWEQINSRQKPSTDPWVPTGSAFLMANTSGRFSGQKAQLFLPQFKENDTHCVIFQLLSAGREGSSPGQMLIYVKENSSPLGQPVWNYSGPAMHTWQQVELAVSTFWPNFYQLVFEVVASGDRGLLAVKGISRQGHQCRYRRS